MQHVSRRVCKNDMTSDRLQTPNSNVKRCALKLLITIRIWESHGMELAII
jgi:hypothetical protein